MLGYNVTVDSLESSVTSSSRNFACENEKVIYRCRVTVNNTGSSSPFTSVWMWNTTQVNTFTSDQAIGINNTCNQASEPRFIHTTLVLTTPTTCESLLIVIPSLAQNIESYRKNSSGKQVLCEARNSQGQICDNMTRIHNLSSKYKVIYSRIILAMMQCSHYSCALWPIPLRS